MALGLVEIAEVSAPQGVTPVCWQRLTTLPIGTLAEATEVARLYRLHWRIEQLFRTLKSDGLDFEATQVTDARRLFKLAALGLVAVLGPIGLSTTLIPTPIPGPSPVALRARRKDRGEGRSQKASSRARTESPCRRFSAAAKIIAALHQNC